MVNLLDLRYFIDCKKKALDLANDPDFAYQVKAWLDDNQDVRIELPDVYVAAIRTIEKSQKPS